MVRINNTLNSNWFVHKDKYAIVKNEYKDQLSQAVSKQREQAKSSLQEILSGTSTATATPGLNTQQKAELAAKYDPTNMSRDEYNNFVDELCAYNVIPTEAKGYISCSGLTPLAYAETGVQVSGADAPNAGYHLGSGKNNVLDWVKYRASFEEFDPLSQKFHKSTSALLFGKIEQVLNQLLD